MESSRRQIRAFDLFCGAGGSSCGARQTGVEIAGGVDIWERAAETFALNFPQAKVYCKSVAGLSPRTVAKSIGPIDLLLASPECTNHSVAKGGAPRCEESRRTAFEVIRFAKSWRPRWLVVENVVSMRRWVSYSDWLRDLKAIGYNLQEYRLNAEDFGVAQSRRRLFIVGDLKREPVRPRTQSRSKRSVKSIIDGDFGGAGFSYAFRPVFTANRARPTLERVRRAIAEIGEKPFLLVYYGSDAAGGWQPLNRPLRTITTLDRFAYVRRKNGELEMRMLQPPELAAAMGFPADYAWPQASRRERIKLIGNAVAPPVMEAIVHSQIS